MVGGSGDDDALTPLHPNYIKLLRVTTSILALPCALLALFFETFGLMPTGLVAGPVIVIAVLAILRLPIRRHMARGYAMGADRLRVVRGIWFRSDTVVPFGRVQHIDVDQGPLERAYGIATLTLHTAGTHNASVKLPGIEHALAMEMREEIRSHIKREAM